MGNLELGLLLKYGVPLAVKLLRGGETEDETVEAVKAAIAGMANPPDVGETLLEADDEQAKGIVEGLFGVLTGVTDAFGGLLKAIGGLFGG